MSDKNHQDFLQRAIEAAQKGMRVNSGGPFGAVIVRDNQIIATGCNQVTSTNDPTAHAEVVAIREAARGLKHFSLEGCVLYTTCEPCPMCLAASFWARLDAIYFACSREDAAQGGFDDNWIYQQISLPITERELPMHYVPSSEAENLFAEWIAKPDKTPY